MTKIVWLSVVLFCLAACENSAKVESEADRLKETLEIRLEITQDSAKAKGERTLEAIKEKVQSMGSKKDSVGADTLRQVN